jgi:hypothetical protein
MNTRWGLRHLEMAIGQGCGAFMDKFTLHHATKYPYIENGLDFYVVFDGYNEKPGKFEIIEGSQPAKSLTGSNLTYTSDII